MADYLVRRNLAGVVQMVDSRHGFTDLDRRLLSFVALGWSTARSKLLVLLTKADKLNRKGAGRIAAPRAGGAGRGLDRGIRHRHRCSPR